MEQEEIVSFIRDKQLLLFIVLILFLGVFVFFFRYFIGKKEFDLKREVKTENLEQGKLPKKVEIVVIDKFEKRIKEMSFEQKIGQILLTSLDGEELSFFEFNLLKEGSVSGFLLFSKNIKDEEQLKKLTFEINKTAIASASGISPILAVDQEGGNVSRIDWIEKTGQNEVNTEKEAYQIGLKRGEQLKDLGIWMNFSPVVECRGGKRRPEGSSLQIEEDFISKQNRSFENNCKELALAMVDGYKESGVLGVAKHFPDGLSFTDKDPHLDLPQIDVSRDELDLESYKYLVEKGIESLMGTHLVYTKIDDDITSRSKVFIRDILRDELGFDGLVVIDDLSMKAVSENYDLGEFVVTSVKNGGDLFIVSNRKDYEYVYKYLVENGEEDEEFVKRLEESGGRILRVKETYLD